MMPSQRSAGEKLRFDPALLCVGVFTLWAAIIYVLPFLWSVTEFYSHGLSLGLMDKDFLNYWLAGRMVLAGDQHDLFIHDLYFTHLKDVVGADAQIRSWSYPPHFLLLVWPLGLLDYTVALIVFLVVTFALFVAAVLVFRRAFAPYSERLILWLAVAAYALMMLDATQNGFLTAAALLFGLAWMKSRPVLAGLAFAVLTIKPQLGLMIPVLLICDRNWVAIRWSAIFATILVVFSAVLFGFDTWHAYLTETLAYQRYVMTDWGGIFLRMMPTVFGSLRTLGFSPDLAIAVQSFVSLVAVVLVIAMLRKEKDPLRQVFIVTCGTFLITPYAFNYDMGALSVAAALVVGSDQLRRNAPTRTIISVIAVLAGIVTNLGRADLPVAPLILAAGLLTIAFPIWSRSHTGTAQ